VDLNHSFTVPASVAETWRTFEDIESVAGCFPGATVTEVDGDDFKGSCKVKLGPIALVYSGSGTFLERDESAGRFVVEAKGKDKRGNGTAGATVTATFTDEAGAATRVDVHTDLSITGKPAQFGRGVTEDISNKLLQQFVSCLQDKVGAPAAESEDAASASAAASAARGAAVGTASAGGEALGTAAGTGSAGGEAAAITGSAPQAATVGGGGMPSPPAAAPSAPPGRPAGPPAGADDALDLGATVLPILAKTYGPAALAALVALVVGYLLGRRSR
jgi:uncharacterized protein